MSSKRWMSSTVPFSNLSHRNISKLPNRNLQGIPKLPACPSPKHYILKQGHLNCVRICVWKHGRPRVESEKSVPKKKKKRKDARSPPAEAKPFFTRNKTQTNPHPLAPTSSPSTQGGGCVGCAMRTGRREERTRGTPSSLRSREVRAAASNNPIGNADAPAR